MHFYGFKTRYKWSVDSKNMFDLYNIFSDVRFSKMCRSNSCPFFVHFQWSMLLFLLHGIAFVFILLKLLDYLFTQTIIIQGLCKIVSIINTAPNMPLPTLTSPNYKSNVHIPKYHKNTKSLFTYVCINTTCTL